MSDSIRIINSEFGFLPSEINRGAFAKAHERIEKIGSLLTPLLEASPEDAKLLDFKAKLEKCEADLAVKEETARINKIVDEAKRKTTHLGAYIRQGNFEKVKQDIAEANNILDQIADQTLKPVADLRQKLSDEEASMEKAIKEKGIKDLKGNIRTKRSQLDRNINSTNDQMKLELVAEIESIANELKLHYPDDADPEYKQTMEYLEKCTQKIKADGGERQAKELTKKADNTLATLRRYLESKNIDKCVEFKAMLDNEVGEIETSIAKDHPIALDFINKAKSFLSTLDAAIGPLIAEKEIEKFIPALKQAIEALKKKVERKDLTGVPKSQKEVEDLVVRLSPYKGASNVDQAIQDANDYIEQVNKELGDVVTAIQIDDAARSIQSSLSMLEKDLSNLNLNGILKNKDRVKLLAAPLMIHSGHPNAKPVVERLEKVFSTIDKDLAEQLSEIRSNEVINKVNQYLRLMHKSKEEKDNNSVLIYGRKAYEAAYPLEQEYPDQSSTKTLMTTIEEAAVEVGLSELLVPLDGVLNGTLEKAESLLKIVLEETSKSPVSANAVQAHLTNVNNAVLTLRTNLIACSVARDFLKKLDSLNRQYFGCIPGLNNNTMPVFEINFKLPREIQTSLKKINESGKYINKDIESLEQLLDIPQGYMDGTEPFRYHINIDSNIDRDLEYRVKDGCRYETSILDQLEKVERELGEIAKHDPENASLSIADEATNKIRAYIGDMAGSVKNRWRYALNLHWANHIMAVAESFEAKESDEFNTPRRGNINELRFQGPGAYYKAHEFYPRVFEYLLTADSILETAIYGNEDDDHSHYDHALARYEGLRDRIRSRMLEVHNGFAKFLQAAGFPQDAESWADGLKGSCYPEYQALDAELQEIKKNREIATQIATEKHEVLAKEMARLAQAFTSELNKFISNNPQLKKFEDITPFVKNLDPNPYKNIYEGETYDKIVEDEELLAAINVYYDKVYEGWRQFIKTVYDKYGQIVPALEDRNSVDVSPLVIYNPYKKGDVYTDLGNKIDAMTTRSERVIVNYNQQIEVQKKVPFFYQDNVVKAVKTETLVAFKGDKIQVQEVPDMSVLN